MQKTLLMKIVGYNIPEEYQNRNDVLVCDNCSPTSALGTFILSLFSAITFFILIWVLFGFLAEYISKI